MRTIFAAALNGALILATAAGFQALGSGSFTDAWAIASYVPSLVLAAGCAFVSIGGRLAMRERKDRDVLLCAVLAAAWTLLLVGATLFLLATLLPANWLNAETAKAWLLLGTTAQAGLLAVLWRRQTGSFGRNLELK